MSIKLFIFQKGQNGRYIMEKSSKPLFHYGGERVKKKKNWDCPVYLQNLFTIKPIVARLRAPNFKVPFARINLFKGSFAYKRCHYLEFTSCTYSLYTQTT